MSNIIKNVSKYNFIMKIIDLIVGETLDGILVARHCAIYVHMYKNETTVSH
jgi:hypothetical protein